MNPNYVHTITLYRAAQGAWTKTVFHNCFFKAAITVTQNGTQATQANTYTVRIPLSEAGAGFTVSNNDIVVLGECADEISNEQGCRAAEVLNRNKPNAFRVSAITDNTGHLMDKHYRLGG